ncbi:signal recognition particle-docking protein FtsY, partial [Microbacteriaceae bacterium K1510]|nr:signal recognition particle-docking protein FtsY [Microbacteriaceae bacterium K1510]
VMELIDELRGEVRKHKIEDALDLQPILSEKLVVLLKNDEAQDAGLHIEEGRLNVLLFVGVNGVGKTTTIGKMAHMFKQQG